MFAAPMRGHNFSEYIVNNSPPPLGVRDYPVMVSHSPTHLGSSNVNSLSSDEAGKIDPYSHLDDKYVEQMGGDKYVSCGLGEDKYVSNLSPAGKYHSHMSPDKYESDTSMMNGDCTGSPVRNHGNVIQISNKDGTIKMESNPNQTYVTLPPFLN